MQESILRFFQSTQNPFLDKLFTYITMLGEQYFIILIVTWIFWNYSKKEGFILTFLFVISNMVNILAKAIAHTQRPFQKLDNFGAQRIHTAIGHSFPSGHTQAASTLFLALALIFKERKYMIGAIIIALLVATSRMYLGVHWPIDVIGGFLLACAVVFPLYRYFYKLYDNPKMFHRVILITLGLFYLILLVLALLNSFVLKDPVELESFYKMVGIATGTLLGFILEERKFPYSVEALRWKKYLRFVIGLGGTVGLLVGLKHVLPEHPLGAFICYFLVGAWICGIFTLIGLKTGLFNKGNL